MSDIRRLISDAWYQTSFLCGGEMKLNAWRTNPKGRLRGGYSMIGNRFLFSKLANIEFTCPKNLNRLLLLPDSNLFLQFQNNLTAEFWATFSYRLLLQRFFWKFAGIFIISIKADTTNFSKISAKFFTRCDFLGPRLLPNNKFCLDPIWSSRGVIDADTVFACLF